MRKEFVTEQQQPQTCYRFCNVWARGGEGFDNNGSIVWFDSNDIAANKAMAVVVNSYGACFRTIFLS